MYYQSVTSEMEDWVRAVDNDATTSLPPANLILSTHGTMVLYYGTGNLEFSPLSFF